MDQLLLLRSKKAFSKKYRRRINYQLNNKAKSQLFKFARLITDSENMILKRRYVYLIRNIAQKIQLPIPKPIKYSFCRRCSEPFTFHPQITFRIRLRSKPVTQLLYTCLKCGYIRRYPIKKSTAE